MPDFAANSSRILSSLEVRRTVTGLAGSGEDGIASEHAGHVTEKSSWIKFFGIAGVSRAEYKRTMSDSEHAGSSVEEVELTSLHSDTVNALRESAHRNRRAVREEAEYIIRAHLAEYGDIKG